MEILKPTGIRLYIANQFNGPQIREVYFTLEDTDEIVFTDITETDATRIIEHLTKLFNPSGAAPQAGTINLTEIEGLLREYYTKNTDGKGGGYGLRLLKSITATVAPQTAGPVWVKGIDRIPEKGKGPVHIKVFGTPSIGNYNRHHEMFIDDAGDFFPPDQVKWLDESNTQKVFTREDMAKAYKEGGAVVVDMMNQVHPQTFDEYMNTNYPIK